MGNELKLAESRLLGREEVHTALPEETLPASQLADSDVNVMEDLRTTRRYENWRSHCTNNVAGRMATMLRIGSKPKQ
jgi:hypothetical protein